MYVSVDIDFNTISKFVVLRLVDVKMTIPKLIVIAALICTSSSFTVDLTEEKQCDCSDDQSAITPNGLPKADCDNVCLTPECIHEASRVIQRMDVSVDPCDDFYDFACGRFVQETIIPDEKSEVDIFSIIQDKVNIQLRSLINEDINLNDPAPFNMAKKLYRTCMNESLIEEVGMEPLLSTLDKLGGWPVVHGDRWNENSEWNWTWTIKELRKYGYSADSIFGFTVGGDWKNASVPRIFVKAISLMYPSSATLN